VGTRKQYTIAHLPKRLARWASKITIIREFVKEKFEKRPKKAKKRVHE